MVLTFSSLEASGDTPPKESIVMNTKHKMFEGVLYENKGTRSIALRSWIVYLNYDFNHFSKNLPNVIESLKNYVKQIDDSYFFIMDESARNITHSFTQMIESQKVDLRNTIHKFEHISEEISQVSKLLAPSRNKRSLIPQIGSVLSSLFGSVTEAEMDSVALRVQNLESQNQMFSHFQSEKV